MCEMTEKNGKFEVLAAIFEQIPEPMQRHLAGLAQAILDEQQDHAARVSDLETEAAARIQQIDGLRVQAATLDVEVAALRDEAYARRDEVFNLRRQNAAMLDERAAHQEVIASVERYNEMKRRVDALLASSDAIGAPGDPDADGEAADVASSGTDGPLAHDDGRGAERATAVAVISAGGPLDGPPMPLGDDAQPPRLAADVPALAQRGGALGEIVGGGAEMTATCPPGRRSVRN